MAKYKYQQTRDRYFTPRSFDPDKEIAEVPKDVYNFYRYLHLWNKVNVEIVSKFRTQIVHSAYLEPLVRNLCMSFLRDGDLSVTDEQIEGAKKDLEAKTLRVGKDLDFLWEAWYDYLCKTVRAEEPQLPTITR